MFNRNAGIILLIALAAGLGLLAAQQVFAPGFEGLLQVGKRTFARVLLVAA